MDLENVNQTNKGILLGDLYLTDLVSHMCDTLKPIDKGLTEDLLKKV